MRANSLSDVAAFAGPLAIFVAALVPGVGFWDTGEMQTVPTILGIAHPTGFPAFVLLGWLFAHGVPFESPAWRVSLLSACAAAGAAWLLFRFVRSIVHDTWIALAAAGAYAAGDIVWTRAARAEVHDLALFFTVLALVLAARAAERADPRCAAGAGAAFGCGLATHPVVALALPSIALLAWPSLLRMNARAWVLTVVAALAPLGLYLYIPLRSAQVERGGLDATAALGLRGGPFWNYDAPSTPARFLRYAFGATFHPADAFRAAATSGGVHGALAFARTVVATEYGVVMAALVITGFVYLAVTERHVAGAFAALALATGAFIPNFRAESDALRYALPVLWAAGVCAAVGACWVMRSLTRERSPVSSALAVALLLVALWPSALYAARDAARQRRTDDARLFIASVIEQTPGDALVIATWTYATPLAYAAFVAHTLGRRRLISGWPSDFNARYDGWRAQFAHIYFILPPQYQTAPLAKRVFATWRWQLAELER